MSVSSGLTSIPAFKRAGNTGENQQFGDKRLFIDNIIADEENQEDRYETNTETSTIPDEEALAVPWRWSDLKRKKNMVGDDSGRLQIFPGQSGADLRYPIVHIVSAGL
jgi:hypothetical protein